MLVALGFHAGDLNATKELLRWIQLLDKKLNHSILLLADCSTQYSDCLELLGIAKETFSFATLITTKESKNTWPAGPNYMFLVAAKHIQNNYKCRWLWMEADAIPLCKGWLDQIAKEDEECGMQFTGAVVQINQAGLPAAYLNGVAVYPANAFELIEPLVKERAWDISMAELVVPQSHNSRLFCHLWGQKDNPPTFREVRDPAHPEQKTINSIPVGTVLFHRNKDGTLLRLLRYRNAVTGDDADVFAHGGDVGDMIYGMAAMKALGRKPLILHHHPVREPWNGHKVQLIAPLLEMQPYIEWVEYKPEAPKTKWNFNPFREKNWSVRGTSARETLCDTQLSIFNLPRQAKDEPWIQVDRAVKIEGKPVVIHRSPRYHNETFPWREIGKRYGTCAVFVGTPNECKAWQMSFGPIRYYPTANYLELARVIAGSVLFIGNQSCPYAIAEGMKRNAILESFHGALDCQFYRKNLANNPNGSQIILPTISDLISWEKQTNIATS